MRNVTIGAAQIGGIQKDEGRQAVVARMMRLLEAAIERRCDLVVFPELTLTTFFPRWYLEDPAEVAAWFEHDMPNEATRPLFERARDAGVAISFGYAEATPGGHHFNTQILTDRAGAIIGKYRKVHLPGHAEYDPERTHQHLEKRYFEPGDLGFPVWRTENGLVGMMVCNDRRWPEAYRVMGLKGVELIILGYNTPSVNNQRGEEVGDKRMFHNHLVMQAGAYQNSCWVVGVAKCGDEDGHHMIGGTCIIDPDGVIVALAKTEADELVVHTCDLEETRFGKETMFDFFAHRRTEHYGIITSQTGVVLPD